MMKKISSAVLAGLLVLSISPAMAAEEDYIKYRQLVMKSLSANLKASGMILKGQVEGDLKAHAAAVANDANAMNGAFPEGSDFGETDAKAEVWEEADKFKQELETFNKNASAFAANPNGETMGAVGKGCKSCHKAFREK